MDNFQWRGRTKIVAVVDVILTSLELLMCTIAFVFIATHLLVHAVENKDRLKDDIDFGRLPVTTPPLSVTLDKLSKDQKDLDFRFMLVLDVFITFFEILQVFVAILLLNATEIGREPSDALKKTRTWGAVHVLMTLIFTVIPITMSFILWHVIHPMFIYVTVVVTVYRLLRGISLFVVLKFIDELELHSPEVSSPNCSVIVSAHEV